MICGGAEALGLALSDGDSGDWCLWMALSESVQKCEK